MNKNFLTNHIDSKMKKLIAPSADRNKEPILKVLQKYLKKDETGNILEIASGTGQHTIYFANHFPKLMFQPTEITDENIESIKEYIKESENENISKPRLFDILQYE